MQMQSPEPAILSTISEQKSLKLKQKDLPNKKQDLKQKNHLTLKVKMQIQPIQNQTIII